MSEESKNYEDIQHETIMEKLKPTDVYSRLMQERVPEGEEKNGRLIALFIAKYDAINPVINFVKGNYTKRTAFELFRAEAEKMLERYRGIRGFFEKLFNELTNIIRSVDIVAEETHTQVDEVLETVEVEDVTEGDLAEGVPLEKNKPVVIKMSKRLTVTIVRNKGNQDHLLTLTNSEGKLLLTCPTSDMPKGKKMAIEIEAGEEYAVGMQNKTLLNRAKLAYEKAHVKLKEAEGTLKKHFRFSKVSIETIVATERYESAEQDEKSAKLKLAQLGDNPLLQWFTDAKSPDISPDHIIIEFDEKGTVTITDEGEKCNAKLEVFR